MHRSHSSLQPEIPDEYIFAPWNAPAEIQEAAGCIVGLHVPQRIVLHEVVSKENFDISKKVFEKPHEKHWGLQEYALQYCKFQENHPRFMALDAAEDGGGSGSPKAKTKNESKAASSSAPAAASSKAGDAALQQSPRSKLPKELQSPNKLIHKELADNEEYFMGGVGKVSRLGMQRRAYSPRELHKNPRKKKEEEKRLKKVDAKVQEELREQDERDREEWEMSQVGGLRPLLFIKTSREEHR